MLAAAGLQTRVKRVGGGYREVPYTADELLGVAASLGDQLRAIAAERDRILSERAAAPHETTSEATLQQITIQQVTIEQLRIEIEELRQLQEQHRQQQLQAPPPPPPEPTVDPEEHERVLREKAQATAQLQEQLMSQQAFARQWRAQLEDLRFAHAEAEAELWCAHTAELTAATAELSTLEAESVALRKVAMNALSAELKSRSLGSPAAIPAATIIDQFRASVAGGGSGSVGGASARHSPSWTAARAATKPTSPLFRMLRERDFEGAATATSTTIRSGGGGGGSLRGGMALPEYDATPLQYEKYTPQAEVEPSRGPSINTASFMRSRVGQPLRPRSSRNAVAGEASADSHLERKKQEVQNRYAELKALAAKHEKDL